MTTIHTTYETARAELEAMENPTVAQLRDKANDDQKIEENLSGSSPAIYANDFFYNC